MKDCYTGKIKKCQCFISRIKWKIFHRTIDFPWKIFCILSVKLLVKSEDFCYVISIIIFLKISGTQCIHFFHFHSGNIKLKTRQKQSRQLQIKINPNITILYFCTSNKQKVYISCFISYGYVILKVLKIVNPIILINESINEKGDRVKLLKVDDVTINRFYLKFNQVSL